MGSFSFAEIVTILLVVLVIFGPNRLPEFARKLGELMAQARRVTSQFSKDISSEWGEAVGPILAVKEDFDGVKQDLKDATAAISGLGASQSTDQPSEGDDGRQTTDDGPEAEAEASAPLSRGMEEERSDDSAGSSEPEATDDESPNGQGAGKELGEA